MQIQGQAALVTGGASGLGEATARELARLGAKVAVLDRNAELAEKVATAINTEFGAGSAMACACDITDAASVTAAIDQAAAAAEAQAAAEAEAQQAEETTEAAAAETDAGDTAAAADTTAPEQAAPSAA